MLTAQQRQSYIDQIRALPEQLTALVHDLSEEQLTTPYLTGEWTVAQNVHHLADSHMNSYIRCKLIATEDNPPLKPYDQDQWATFADATAADVSVSLQLLSSLHTRWVMFWEGLSEEAWQRTGHHPETVWSVWSNRYNSMLSMASRTLIRSNALWLHNQQSDKGLYKSHPFVIQQHRGGQYGRRIATHHTQSPDRFWKTNHMWFALLG